MYFTVSLVSVSIFSRYITESIKTIMRIITRTRCVYKMIKKMCLSRYGCYILSNEVIRISTKIFEKLHSEVVFYHKRIQMSEYLPSIVHNVKRITLFENDFLNVFVLFNKILNTFTSNSNISIVFAILKNVYYQKRSLKIS